MTKLTDKLDKVIKDLDDLITKFNSHHGSDGRFATGSGGAGGGGGPKLAPDTGGGTGGGGGGRSVLRGGERRRKLILKLNEEAAFASEFSITLSNHTKNPKAIRAAEDAILKSREAGSQTEKALKSGSRGDVDKAIALHRETQQLHYKFREHFDSTIAPERSELRARFQKATLGHVAAASAHARVADLLNESS